MTSTERAGAAGTGAAAALVLNALVWGTSWWPFRWLAAHGLHPLWATALCYALAVALIVALRPRAVRQLFGTPALWAIMASAGVTNATFNWGVATGDVVRVVLLFYVMPVWSVLLARLLLGERITGFALARVALALAGALIVLWPAAPGWPWPRSLADGLGLAGGFSFALTTVLLRRERHRAEEGRALAMFTGGALVAATLALGLGAAHGIAPPPAPAPGWLAMLAALAAFFLVGNLALQYGTAHLSAQRTAVIMLTEVLFATVSSVLLGASAPTVAMAAGGALIVAGSWLAARSSAP